MGNRPSNVLRFPAVFLLTVLFLLKANPVLAQGSKGAISGHIADPSGAVLKGAKISLDPSDLNVVSDIQGDFLMTDLNPGTYTVQVTYVGFAPFAKTVTVEAGKTAAVDAAMQLAAQNLQVLVTASRPSAEAAAVNQERSADNIVQVLPADVIRSLPNANMADALGRLPGVTLERDEGEGKYVQIRGTEPRLTNTTIDGMNVPSPETGVRQIKFDAIPADIVEAVEINKTLQANMDGDGIGGSVNLVTKTAQDRPTISLSGMGGFTPIDTGRGLTEWTGTLGERFGKEKRWGALFGASYDWNGRGIDDIEPVADINTLPNGSMQRSFDQIAVRQYVYYRSRWAIAGSTDYKLGAGSDIFVRWLYSDFKNYGDRTEYVLNNNDPTVNLLNPTSGSPSFDTQDRRPDIAIGTLTFGGIHSFSTIWYRWEGSVSRPRDTNVAPGQASFSSTLSSSACQYNPAATTNLYLPQWTPSCYAEAYNQDNYALSNIQISYGKSAQLNLQGTMSVGKQYHLGSHAATFEIGGKFRNAHKFDDTYSVQLTPTGTIPLSQFPSRLTNNNYYGGSYPAGPDPHYQDVIAYANANPGQFTSQSTFGADPANYDLVEKVSAGYLMNTIDVTSRLRFIAGLRIEGTQLTTFSFDTTSNVLADRATGSYVSVLPSAALRYGLTSRDDIRLSYARGLARPDPQDIAQAVTFTTTGSPGSLKNTATLGNPDLKAETGDNFDLLYEHYFDTFGMFSAGYFYKRLTDPIATEGFIKTDFQPSPIAPSGTYSVTQPINAGSAWISDSKLLTCNTFRSFRACCEVSARRQTTATRHRRPAAYPGERITPDSCATPRTHGISAPLTI